MRQGKIETLLAGLQTPTDGKILFEDYLQEAWKLFQLPHDPDLPQFEAFLISAVFYKFENAEHNRYEAISRDACLVGLGLLAGCYHTETKVGIPAHCTLQDRCISYLSSDYVRLQYPDPQEDDNLDITDSDSLPQDAFGQSMRRGLEKLAGTLDGMIKNDRMRQACLQAGIEKHTELVTVLDGNKERKIRRVILPQPCYTLENFAPKGKKKSAKTTQEIGLESTESVKPVSETSAEQVQNSQLGFISEPSASTHEPSPAPTAESASEPSIKPAQKSAPGTFLESAQGQSVDTDTALEPASELVTELTPGSAQEITQEPVSESSSELAPEASSDTTIKPDPESGSDPLVQSHIDAPDKDEVSPPPTVEPEPPKPTKTLKSRLLCLLRAKMRWDLVVILAVLVGVGLLIEKYANDNKSQNTGADQVEAAEGGGVPDTNEISDGPDASILLPGHNNTRFDMTSSEPDKIASVLVEVTYSDGRTETATMKLGDLYNEAETEQQGVGDEDSSGGADTYGNEN